MILIIYLFSLFILIFNSPYPILSSLYLIFIWSSLVITSFISVLFFYKSFFAYDSLELYILSNISLEFIFLFKIFTFWIINILPLIIFSPLLLFFLSISLNDSWLLLLNFILTSLVLITLGILTLTLTFNSFLYFLFLLPLSLPFLIFKSFLLTGTFLIFYLWITPFLCGYFFKNGLKTF